ncbi:hypothetical protein COCON_G00037870 [Conger conger]|uniref:Uncharacterized protein n=1 Tax=Conger conger TaxID=82655 RepID=A0A9Q1I605_CONCO|nr:hypothetical protein COCON_G00037870 [Conger conger]
MLLHKMLLLPAVLSGEQPPMMQAASFVTVVAAIFHHLSKVGYEIITPITVQQEQGAFSKSPSMGPSPKCLEFTSCGDNTRDSTPEIPLGKKKTSLPKDQSVHFFWMRESWKTLREMHPQRGT